MDRTKAGCQASCRVCRWNNRAVWLWICFILQEKGRKTQRWLRDLQGWPSYHRSMGGTGSYFSQRVEPLSFWVADMPPPSGWATLLSWRDRASPQNCAWFFHSRGLENKRRKDDDFQALRFNPVNLAKFKLTWDCPSVSSILNGNVYLRPAPLLYFGNT